MSDLKRELLRKIIHFSGLLYIPCYSIFGFRTLSLALVCMVPLIGLIEFFRLKKGLFKFILRDYEEKSIGAYVYFFLSLIVLTFFFPKDTAFVAVITSIVGDGFAGIFRHLGKNNLASFAMFTSSSIFILILSLLTPFSIFAVMVGTVVERIKKVRNIKIQDNLSVPFSTALADSVKYIF